MIETEIYTEKEKDLLSCCTLCPRECGADRFEGGTGYCGADAGLNIASICIHRGEEPPVSGTGGICNIFFAGCNMRCIYCQNFEISRPESVLNYTYVSLQKCLDIVQEFLDHGIKAVGFVSPSHVVPQVKAIIRGLHDRNLRPVTVYNTNSYEKVETLRELSDFIDVYLPDYKYVSPKLSVSFSDTLDYPQVALKALKEMYYQKGSVLITDNEGNAVRGMIIRHLVLPGHSQESIKVLRTIAEELSTGVHLSLMSQYYPTKAVREHPIINRTLYATEYEEVVKEMERLGFRNGWLQDTESFRNYLPDFSKEHPFE